MDPSLFFDAALRTYDLQIVSIVADKLQKASVLRLRNETNFNFSFVLKYKTMISTIVSFC